MKFLYSDTQDYVDPEYDFVNDRNAPGRERYWDDVYAHQMFETPPYDGLLVAMSAMRQIDGAAHSKARYSTKEEMRFLRDGARVFLRLNEPRYTRMYLMGDCGAFAYANEKTPAFSPQEVVEFYSDAQFTHGISPDHIIFDLDESNPTPANVSSDTLYRYEVTLRNAEEFLKLAKADAQNLVPIGSIQGWSPLSIAASARQLEKMGYDYLAVGGLVPLKSDAIKRLLAVIREHINPQTKLHLLGFAKAESIDDFLDFGIHSFDSTSPLIRAFKDSKANYYFETEKGLEYYAAIRIPQYSENSKFIRAVKRGVLNAEDLHRHESQALQSLRSFDQGKSSKQETIELVQKYLHFFRIAGDLNANEITKAEARDWAMIDRTLTYAPWKRCGCEICKAIGIEVVVFRSANRNRRRGFHNLWVYKRHLEKITRG